MDQPLSLIHILIGCVLVKARLLKSADSRVLSVVMVYAVMPCVIINAFQVDYSPDVYKRQQ